MQTIEFIDAVTEMLGTMKLQGNTAIPISDENRQFLRKLYVGKKPDGRAVPAPVPTPASTPKPVFTPPAPQPVAPPQVAQPAAPRTQAPPFRPPAPQPTPTAQPSPADQAFTAVPNPPVAGMDWATLASTAKGCHACKLCQGRNTVVFEDGNRNADLMFIGEGPGADEDSQGIPFVGKAGQLLTKIIEAMGFSRQDVYIATIVKCRPPESRNPEPDEAEACLHFLERQIQLVQPKAIVLLGAIPLQNLLKERGIMSHRGKWMEYKGIPVMPTFHPSFLLRKPEHKRDVWNDVQLVMKTFDINPPSDRK
jgi:uracil-DNA glycosylase family 4